MSEIVLVDSGILIAFYDRQDTYHDRVVHLGINLKRDSL
jgi:predicted nucleic acid-binding protein